ncbi:MAG: hypothetical protein V7641_2255 [Blastocatellia bacterium]
MRIADFIRKQGVARRGKLWRGALALAVLFVVASLGVMRFNAASPRTWSPGNVPIAFWAWRSRAPRQEDVERAMAQANARTLFLRAGQIDYRDGQVRRMRAAAGRFSTGIEIHLVYNATPVVLAAFERIDIAALVDEIAAAYADDAQRAAGDAARVAGVQLDFDVPTRLLTRYAMLLSSLRQRLPAGSQLSITGLPTWMAGSDLNRTLAAVDFWIPQLYGEQIPSHIDETLAIASPQKVARDVRRAASLNRPFYAGLAAYGYAIHYASNGARLAVLGDLDPAIVVARRELQLIERRAFDSPRMGESPASEWRYVYRATEDVQLDHLLMRAGEWLMLDVPTAEALAACGRAVREQAGEHLLGVCLFRLPESDDVTALTLAEIACALNGEAPGNSFIVEATNAEMTAGGQRIRLKLANNGAARARLGDGAASLLVRVPAGSLRQLDLHGFDSAALLCEVAGDSPPGAITCSLRRASAAKLELTAWLPSSRASALLTLAAPLPTAIDVIFTLTTDDGREISERRTIPVQPERKS